MGLYSAKKPYHNLKASIMSFYKQRILFMKQLLEKFSEFEKPYVEESYPEMHLQIPAPDWPNWWSPWVPGVWGLPLPEAPESELPPGPGSQFTPPPPDDESGGWVGGCSVDGMPAYSEPGDVIVLWISTRCFTAGSHVGGNYVKRCESASLSVMGPGTLTVKHGAGWFMTVLIIDDNAQDQDVVCVNVTTSGERDGEPQSCGACTIIEAACNCEELGAYIDYTTLTMGQGMTQTLYGQPRRDWEWSVTQNGKTTKSIGKSVVVYAPDETNTDCKYNIEVEMACPGEDGELCDSIAIGVNTRTGTCDRAYRICCQENLCCIAPGLDFSCAQWYDCEGNLIPHVAGTCLGDSVCAAQCAGPNYIQSQASEGDPECDFTTNDQRTSDQLNDGCCPGALA